MVVFLLMRDVIPDRFKQGNAHGKSAVAILPFKIFFADGFMHPGGRGSLHIPHYIGQPVCGAHSQQQMDVIGNATDSFGDNVKRLGRAAEIGVQTRTPSSRNQRTLVFCSKHDMEM